MDIISAYREVGTYRGAAAMWATTHRTVRRVIECHEAGEQQAERAPRERNYDQVKELVTDKVTNTRGRIPAWLESGQDVATQRGHTDVCQGGNGGADARERPPRQLRIRPLDHRDAAAALEDVEPGVAEHLLGHAGTGNVVGALHPVEVRGRRVPGDRLEAGPQVQRRARGGPAPQELIASRPSGTRTRRASRNASTQPPHTPLIETAMSTLASGHGRANRADPEVGLGQAGPGHVAQVLGGSMPVTVAQSCTGGIAGSTCVVVDMAMGGTMRRRVVRDEENP